MKLNKKNEKVQRKLLKRIAVGAGVATLLAGTAAAVIWADSRSENPRTSLGNALRKKRGDERRKSVEEIWQRHEEIQGVVIPKERRHKFGCDWGS